MKTITRILVAVACAVYAVCAVAQVSPADIRRGLEWYKERSLPIIAELRGELRKPLTDEQRAVEANIDYRVLIDGNCNAFARREGGQRIIETTAGFVQIIDWMSMGMVVGSRLGHPQCFTGYVGYLTDGILENGDRIRAHQALKPVASLFNYAKYNSEDCGTLTQASFRASPGADDMRELLVAGSLKFLLAHELGHHLLGHVLHKKSMTPDEVREQERAADEFAFREMALSGSNPMEGMPVLMLFGALEDFSIEGEERRDHPAGVRRFVTMVEAGEALVNSEPTVVAYMRRSGTYDKFIAGLQQMRAQLRQMEASH